MKCENNLCVYQLNGKCILNKISIDSLGMCAECILPDFDEKTLNESKESFLKRYEKFRF